MTVPPIDYEEIDEHLPNPEHWVTFQSQRVPGVRDRWWSILNAQSPRLNIPVIFDADYFRSLFHDPERPIQVLSLSPLSQPPRERFETIYEEFGKGSLQVWDPDPDPRTQSTPFKSPFDRSNPASRLMDSSQVVSVPGTRWLPGSGRTFESSAPEEIVTKTTSWYALCPYIEPTHSHYNWVDIYCRAFGKSEQEAGDAALVFALKTHRHFYDRIAPLIDLWHWDVHVEIAKRATRANYGSAFGSFVHERQSLSPAQQLQQCCAAITFLNANFFRAITEEQTGRLLAKTNAYDLVAFIAKNQPVRAVVRLLPKGGPAELMAGLIRDAIFSGLGIRQELLEMLKLLRDLTTESDIDPELGSRFNVRDFHPKSAQPGGGPLGSSMEPTSAGSVAGSEARVIFGTLGDLSVAVREPLEFGNFDKEKKDDVRRVRQYIFRKRYKKTLVQQHCLTHRNLMPILGWFKKSENDLLPSVVMPRMGLPLGGYQIRGLDEYNRLMNGTLQGLAYLHSWSVVHGDLHWGNILISPEGEAIITDFGHSRLLIKRMHEFRLAIDSNTTPPLPSKLKLFMPPEIRRLSAIESDPDKSRTRPDHKTDIYSLGIVMLLSALPRDVDAGATGYEQEERRLIADRLVDLIAGEPDNVDKRGQSGANASSRGSLGSLGTAKAWGSFGEKKTPPKTKKSSQASDAKQRAQKASSASTAPHRKSIGTPGSRSTANSSSLGGSLAVNVTLHPDVDRRGASAVMESPASLTPPPNKLDSSLLKPGATIVPLQSISIPNFAPFVQPQPARGQVLWDFVLHLVDRVPKSRPDIHEVVSAFNDQLASGYLH